MEKWIKANEGKLMLIAGLFTLWCFYSVVSQGGSTGSKIKMLEGKMEELLYTAREHTHRYHDGKPNPR